MAKFLFVYRGSTDAMGKMTPDEIQKNMQQWGVWIGEAMQKGWMVNPDGWRCANSRWLPYNSSNCRSLFPRESSPWLDRSVSP